MRRVAIAVLGHDRTPLVVDTVGMVVASAPGLLVTPHHEQARPVGRFTLTHATSGRTLAPLAWCPHDVRRWAHQAGWVGVDWRRPSAFVIRSQVAYLFAWRLHDEFRPHCPQCPEIPEVDAKHTRRAAAARR
jgi:hypothetical protein